MTAVRSFHGAWGVPNKLVFSVRLRHKIQCLLFLLRSCAVFLSDRKLVGRTFAVTSANLELCDCSRTSDILLGFGAVFMLGVRQFYETVLERQRLTAVLVRAVRSPDCRYAYRYRRAFPIRNMCAIHWGKLKCTTKLRAQCELKSRIAARYNYYNG